MASLLAAPDLQLLAFMAVLGAAGGADLALALLILGILPRLGWTGPPGSLDLLQPPVVLGSVLLLYVAEWLVERHPGGFALWHTFQRWVRGLGLFLLASLATTQVPLPERMLHVSLAVLLGAAVYIGVSGWEGLLLLRGRSGRGSGRLASVAIDVIFGALLALALDEPLQALVALLALLVVGSTQLPVSYRSHRAIVRAGRAWLNAFLLPGRWIPEQELPGWVRTAASSDGLIPGRPLRGARATLLTRTVRNGWLVLASDGPLFVSGKDSAVRLQAVPDAEGRSDSLYTRAPVVAGVEEGELLVLRDGPPIRNLEVEVP